MNPSDELAGAERLGQVVVGADLEADDEIGLGVTCGEHQHRDRSFTLDLAADVEAVEAGEHEVEHHEVGPEALAELHPAGPSAAMVTSKPSLRSRVATASAIGGSSSTTRIVRVSNGEGTGIAGQG